MLRIDCTTGISELFHWIPTIASCISGKYLSIDLSFLWWYIDISFTIVNNE